MKAMSISYLLDMGRMLLLIELLWSIVGGSHEKGWVTSTNPMVSAFSGGDVTRIPVRTISNNPSFTVGGYNRCGIPPSQQRRTRSRHRQPSNLFLSVASTNQRALDDSPQQEEWDETDDENRATDEVTTTTSAMATTTLARGNDSRFGDKKSRSKDTPVVGEDGHSRFNTLQEYNHHLQTMAKQTSLDTTVVVKALQLLEEMRARFRKNSEEEWYPTIETYNTLIEIHAFSMADNGAELAEDILQSLPTPKSQQQPQQKQSTSPLQSTLPQPNHETYATVMDGWMRRGSLSDVERVGKVCEDVLGPHICISNKLIKAHGMAGNVEEAEIILNDLLTAAKSNDERLIPNQKTWIQLLRAYANPKTVIPDRIHHINDILDRMTTGCRNGFVDWKPTIEAYNALLFAQSHSESAKEAEKVLYQLIEQYRNGDASVRPDNDTFYHVLRAIRNEEKTTGLAFKVEKLLQLQDALAKNDESRKPTGRTLLAALDAVSRAKDDRKAVKAQRVLAMWKERSGEASPTTLTPYRSLLKACAYTPPSAGPEDRLVAFQIAWDTLKEINERFRADSNIYGLVMRACRVLMSPTTRKRDALLENIFRQCCEAGFVDEFCVREFQKGASDELQLKMLGGFLEDGLQLPTSWKQNVKRRTSSRPQ